MNKFGWGHWLLLIIGGLSLGNLICEVLAPCPSYFVIRLLSIVTVIEFGIFHFFTVNKQKHE